MKKTIVCSGIAVCLSSAGGMALAGSVSIPNTFQAGTPAIAQHVNDNFDAIATAVNDNDSRIKANADAISKNSSDIADLQAASGAGCPNDMIAAGSLCVDKYEASVTDASGSVRYAAATDYPCAADGNDCGTGSTAGTGSPIFARSEAGVNPSRAMTLYQAAQACANVGKRLPTTTEWQMAAAGTPSGTGSCQFGTDPGLTGSKAACVSNTGAFDMVGNLWEWTSELDYTSGNVTSTDQLKARALGEAHIVVTGTPTTKSIFFPGSGPMAQNSLFGFRCVK